MKARRFLVFMALACLAVGLHAQVARQSGVIRGIVTDNDGTPVPGATVTTSGPALMGTLSDITGSDGSFRLPGLPPGVYAVTVELSGFKTIRQEDIQVRVGMIVSLRLQTEPSTIEEEVTVVATAPTVDVQSSKLSTIVTTETLNKLPLNRNFVDVFKTVPGAAGTIDTYSGSINGATSTTVTYEMDGVNANSPTHGGPLVYPQFDAMEEMEIVTGGLPAQVGNTGGAYVNIVTKSGGNEFHGSAQAYYTNEHLTEILMSVEELEAIGLGKPSSPIFDVDVSGTLGGPIIKDKVWFFLDGGLLKNKKYGYFIPTTINGVRYDQFDLPETKWRGMAKLTTQFSEHMRFFLMFHGELENRDVYNWWESQSAHEATFTIKNNHRIATTGNLTWLLGADTFVDLRAGFVERWYPITSREETDANYCLRDGYTGYIWNGIPTWQSKIGRSTRQASARITHFQDNLLGGNHELAAGVEYVWGRDRYGYERTNPLTWYLYNGNPYYWREYYGLSEAHPTFGDGRISFTNCGANPHDSEQDLVVNRWGAYVQDAFTVQNRLTINGGLRMDYYNGFLGQAVTTGTTGLAFEIGQSLQSDLGFNPFGPFEMDPIEDAMVFTVLSPRIGLTYDLFGDGKTAVKLAYSRYYEQVPTWRFGDISPAVLAQYQFNWFDLNGNGALDSPGVDRYDPRYGMGQFTLPDRDYLISRVDPDLKAPYYDEVIASINHELFKNFAVKAQYLYKRGGDLHGWALYDRDTGRFWYNLDDASEWWVPFTTVVPAYGDYPAKEVTVYFRSQDSPWNNQFYLQTNIPESKHRYHGFELSFDKRYADGWALGGSVVISKHRVQTAGDSPNDFVNGFGLSNDSYYGLDQPLAIKLFGSFDLPFGFVGSFFFIHNSGAPFGRTVTVVPPADWAAANNALDWEEWVRVEESGERRSASYSNIDFRLEKVFPFSFGRLGLFVDIYNALGGRTFSIGNEPGGVWQPDGPNTSEGSYSSGWSYGRVTGVTASRIFKFSVRFTF